MVNEQLSRPIKLVYLIGTYPGLTNTFIDQEIATLRRLGDFQIRIVSIRYPHTIDLCSQEQKEFFKETQYLLSSHWSGFNFPAFLLANFFFILSLPRTYFGTLFYLLSRSHENIKAWIMTILYFWQGAYAASLLRRTEFDHLHVHFMDRAVLVALVVGRFLGKSYSFTAHAADIYTGAALVREKIDNARFMITVSQYNKQHLLKTYPGINPDKIHILHPWVDVCQFTPRADRPIHDVLHILSVGRLVEKKGHMDLIDAAYLLREKGVVAECKIVGEGPLQQELKERIIHHELQESVHLLGGLPQDQVLNLLRDWTDVFVLPCVIARNGDRDGIPVSLAEAMAMKLPVISTDIIGISELVQPGTGILVPAHQPSALAEALSTIAVQEKQTSARMGRKGREVVDREFNLLKGTQELAGFFCQAVGKELPNGKEKDRHAS
ncbi:MAG TPA: glycosyltransferase [Anaerolineales bacterium]|nr:glycosyltransferase [Anaerolineales bacterium]